LYEKTTLKASNFWIETCAPPTNGSFLTFLATKMNLALEVFLRGEQKQNPHFALRQPMASTRHDVG